ncbi:MAG TPA: rhodanese-like domain-containing protein, partial [Chitinophagaceae bacterium]|nr:rhodanese-like domain-containing protein [Chitinophagaceae bacterium]
MLTRPFISLLILASFSANAQFKNDNVTYRTVFPEDLCKTLQANPGYVVLDVRSDGEFYDTMSSSPGLNIGHLKNALHIDIRQLAARWKELNNYKDKPLFIYCSHSQRSRRASRLLADSGFKYVFNINGGLTNFYSQGIQSNPCTDDTIVTTIPYKIVSPKQLAENPEEAASYFIIDIRSDSAFNGKTLNERTKLEGRFISAINKPFENFSASLPGVDQNKPILVVDEFGDKSPLIAEKLMDNGFKNVSILFNGMDEWITYTTNEAQKPSIQWKNFSIYSMLSPDEFNMWMNEKKKFALIDVRPKDQFNNQSKNYWQNLGQIKNAVNIPYAELAASTSLPLKSEPVVVYGFNNQDDIFN